MFSAKRKWTSVWTALAIVSCLCWIPVVAMAQSATGLVGNVTDPQGAIVPGVTITLTSKATSATRTMITDERGSFSIPQLTPGRYSVKAELTGFKTVIVDNIEVLINTTPKLDLKFTEVGGLNESVMVEADAVIVNTTDATIGNAFNEIQVRELPMEARNVVGLLSLQPGVTYIGDATDSRNGAVNGGRSDQANVTLDNVDVNDQVNGAAFTSVLRAPLDSVQEFRVTTAGLNADQGRSSGAQISLVTKQGTNEFHGSVYEYHRNTVTTANDYFLKKSQLNSGLPNKQPKLLRNVYGASFGGPIMKDRLFIFGNFEGRHDAKESSVSRTVPSMDLRNGIVKYKNTAGGVTTLTPDDVKRIDPAGIGANAAALAIFKQFPVPNDTSIGDGLNLVGYRFAAPTPFKYNDYVARLDYNVTRDARHIVYFRGNLQNDKGSGAPEFPGQQPRTVDLNNSKGIAASYKSVLTPRLISSFTYGYTRQGLESAGASTVPAVTFRSMDDLNALTRSNGRHIPVHNIVEDVTWQKSAHSIQFGGNMRWIRNNSFTYANSFPSATTNSSWLLGTGSGLSNPVPDLASTFRTAYRDSMMALLGIVSQGNARYNYDRTGKALAVGAPVLRDYGANEYEVYGQDSWKAKSNLTLIFGLRYSLFSPPFEANGNQVAPSISLGKWFDLRYQNMIKGIPSNAAPHISVDLAGPANGKNGFYEWDRNNFAPRFAFTWSPGGGAGALSKFTGGAGNLVVRGGFSVAYDRIGAGLAQTFDAGGSFGLSTALTNASSSLNETTAPRFTGLNTLPSSLLLPAPPAGFPQTPPNVFAITSSLDDTIRTPYHMLTNFSIQRQLPLGFTVEAAYIGRLARKLLTNDDLAMPVDLVDPASNMDYFGAATILAQNVDNKTPTANIPKIAFWENVFPGLATSTLTATQVAYNTYKTYAPDYTSALYDLDVGCDPSCSKFGKYAFFNDQYSALSAWRSRANSSYNAAQILVRKRFDKGTQFDLNYTLSKSLDLSSQAERTGSFSGFTVNAWNPGLRKGVSDFDTLHSINSNFIVELPFGTGKALAGNANSVLNNVIGGWQASGIYRWTSGLPVSVGEGRFWPTNWNISGNATRITTSPETGTVRNVTNIAGTAQGPNMFANPAEAIKAYRYTYPGDVGTRNDLRGDGFFTIDLGISKSWNLPFEKQQIQFRWETFNVTNSVRFNVNSVTLDLGAGAGNFGSYSSTLTNPRVMQFSLRYQF